MPIRSTNLLVLFAATVVFAPFAIADDPAGGVDLNIRLKGIADRVLEAQKAYAESAKTGKPNIAVLRLANQQRNEELKALAADLEKLPADKQGFAEHESLADIYVKLREFDKALQHADAALAIKADAPVVHANRIIALVEKPDLDAAEQGLTAALAACQDKAPLQALHYRLYMANRRANRPLIAAEHMRQNLLTMRPFKTPAMKSTYLRNVDELANALIAGEKAADAVAAVDSELAFWDAVTGDEAAAGKLVAADLRSRKIRLLHQAGELAAAEELLKAQAAEAQAAIDAQPNDVSALLRMASLLESKTAIAAAEQQATARAEWLKFLTDRLQAQAESREFVSAVTSAYLGQLQQLIRDEQGAAAEALFADYQALVSSTAEDSPAHKSLSAAASMMKSAIRRMVSQRLQTELVGKSMIPLDATVWVNGSPQTADDLKGKVVLLDFWAVWCGPCRATFPHLTAWHEKYEKDGLVIVGLTRYYQYGWDAEAKQHTQVEEISPADEAAALEQFAKHHGLKHRLAFMPEGSTLSESYGVSGIPHVVVIDRQGVIRMIRVGSGEQNAHDIETLLEELVRGTPTGAAGK